MSFFTVLLLFFLSLFATLFGVGALLPVLKDRKMGQTILEIGPAWHKSKEGTPTMGGVTFFFAVSLASLLGCLFLSSSETRTFLWILVYALLNGLIGVFDDAQKLKKRENAGLSPRQKLVLQTVSAIFLLAMLKMEGAISTVLPIPFSSQEIPLGFSFYPLAVFVMVGIVNSANLTDGIDGLASAIATLIGGFFAAEGLFCDIPSLAVLGAAETGCGLGFLAYNRHPAKIFMGDSGSLFFGALAVGGSFLLGSPFIVLFFGLVYVFEGFSVVLQVGYFKLKRKRLFKMAPFHHHLEKSAWSETQIVSVMAFFTLCAILLAHVCFLIQI